MDIEFRQLRCALALAEHGNFGRAARAVHLSQPAFSRNIQELEARVGKRLFSRSTDGTRLTDEGVIFLDQAKNLLGEADRLKRDLELIRGKAGHAEEVRAGLGMFPADFYLPRTMRRLLQKHPDLRVVLTADVWSNLIGPVRKGEVDFAVTDVTDVPAQGKLHFTKLRDHQGHVVVRAGHPLLKIGRAATLPDMMRYPWVLPLQSSGERMKRLLAANLEAAGEKKNQPAVAEIYINSVSMMKRIAEESDAWTVVGLSNAVEELAAGRLEVLPGLVPFYKSNFAVVRSTARQLSEVAEDFINALIEVDAEVAAEGEALERKYLKKVEARA